MKKYKYKHNECDAEVVFLVDESIFKKEDAKLLLDFFSWEYDSFNNPIDELLLKYSLEILKLSIYSSKYEIIEKFENREGYLRIDGENGVKLYELTPFQIDDYNIELNKYITTQKI